jgi:hypothetical protein
VAEAEFWLGDDLTSFIKNCDSLMAVGEVVEASYSYIFAGFSVFYFISRCKDKDPVRENTIMETLLFLSSLSDKQNMVYYLL